MLFELYRSIPVCACYDNDADLAAASAAEKAAADSAAAAAASAAAATFTSEQQAQVNKILAEDKRKHQAQFQKLEKQLQETLSTAKLTADERSKLEEALDNERKRFLSKEEQAKIEKKALEDKYTGEIETLKSRAETAERRYVDSTISRALQDAAITGDAFNSNTVVTVLRPMVKMVDDNPMIDFADISAETGEPIVKQMTPEEAIKRMKQLPEIYGNLFKSGVVGGLGSASATGGLTPGSNGKVDPRKLTMDQYLKLRKENPAALGLK
jgi:Skp family chaperone for outer membrane proteins